MANETTSPPPSSRLLRLVMFAASVGAIVVIYLLRRKPAPSAQSQPALVPAPAALAATMMPAAEAPALESPPKPVILKPWQQLAVLALTFVYGMSLIGLYSVSPQLSTGLVILTLVGILGVLLWRVIVSRVPVGAFLRDLMALPFRYYEAGAPMNHDAPLKVTASYLVSVICLAALVVGIGLLPSLPLVTLVLILAAMSIAAYGWVNSLDVLILERRLVHDLRIRPAADAVALPHTSVWVLLAEMGIILLVTLATTRPFYESPPNWQLSGSEVEWLTSTIYAAHTGLETEGRIPRWQPYVAHGEPTIENPFNFIFNPFAGGPSLVLGPQTGLRLSVIICYFLAGLGGWFMGRVLGFGTLARMLLALILMGKGNIHSALNSSYYQLALSQIYMPWVIGGVIAVMRFPKRRWPVVLTALAIALQLFNGNLWYVLPTVFGAGITALVCVWRVERGRFNGPTMRRYMLTGLLAAGLSAIIALPVALQFNRVGRHDGEVASGWVAPLSDVLPLYFDPNRDRTVTFFEPAFGRRDFHYVRDVDEFYYSFVIPGWYALLIFILLPLYRPLSRRDRWIALVALALFGLATLWGAGGKQPFAWLYENIDALRQWRFVPRALAVASFWLAVLVAMRLDHVWKSIRATAWKSLFTVRIPPLVARVIPIMLSILLVATTAVAAAQVNDQWYQYQSIMSEIAPIPDACTTWLRRQYPDAQLSVWQQDYSSITTFLNNRVRSWNISADFEMVPQQPTFGPQWLDMNAVPPQFGEFMNGDQRAWGRENGYWIIRESPRMPDGIPCLSRRTHQNLSYAYSIPVPYLEALPRPYYDDRLDLSSFAPIPLVERRTDQVALVVTPKPRMRLVVGVQESAYPGWRVEVDGQPAQIESFGRQIGVVIPPGDKPVQVYFVYEPRLPVIGGFITLLTALVCILYLLTAPYSRAAKLLTSTVNPPSAL